MPFSHDRALRDWLHKWSLTISQYWVLEELRLAPLREDALEKAVEGSWSVGRGMEIDLQDAEVAVSSLLSKRIIQEVSTDSLAKIVHVLESPSGVIASGELLLPALGEMTFTLEGARLIVELYEDVFQENPSAEHVDDIGPDGKGCIYACSLQQLSQGILDHRDELVSFANVGQPYPIGPWRSDWWYLNLSGWAVSVQFEQGHKSAESPDL